MAVTIKEGSRHCFVTKYTGNGRGQRVGRFVPYTDNGTISKSCMFESGDSADKLQATIGTSSTANARRKMTLSFWYKWTGTGGNYQMLWTVGGDGQTPYIACYINNNGSRPKGGLTFFDYTGSGSSYNSYLDTKTGFGDTSKWYHAVFSMDTTQATDSNRFKIYIDGNLQDTDTNNYYSENFDTGFGTNVAYAYGTNKTVSSGSYWFNGYMAEINQVDGTAYGPETFGVTDTSTGRWIPKNLSGISYGDNGHRLHFANSAGQTIGDDLSGNGNDFTVSDLAAANITTDSPTQNYPTFDPGRQTSYTYAEGNLDLTTSTNSRHALSNRLVPKTGKWYWEVQIKNKSSGSSGCGLAIDTWSTTDAGSTAEGLRVIFTAGTASDGKLYETYSDTQYLSSQITTFSADDYLGFAYDADSGKMWISKNGTYISSGNPVTGANHVLNAPNTFDWRFVNLGYNNGSAQRHIWNFGQKTFNTAAPTGFSDLNQDNMPTSIDGGEVSEASMIRSLPIPDLMIVKNRDAADRWLWQDSTRGLGEYGSSASGAPGSPVQFNSSITDAVQKRLVGGFQTEDSDYSNSVGEKYVSYNWSANNGVTATDTSGDLSTELQANPTAGFSVGKFTVSGSSNKTWAHGLGAVPHFGILFTYSATTYGTVYHHQWSSSPFSSGHFLTSSAAVFTSSNIWGSAKPTSSLWTGLVGSLFSAGQTYMFYSWTGIPGYSHFGSYTGNGSAAAGPFVYTGFKPKLIWIKSAGAYSNYVFNTETHPNNPGGENVVFDGNYSEASTGNEGIEILSNGFKIRTSSVGTNQDGVHNIFGAWAEHPFAGTSLVNPTTAR